ncbi:MAG TPA: hypothetical protein PL009_08355 [Flavipsychrobacter sp.]|nr:hypothetical protein [Flavipsychrobacter sp.]
MKYTIVLLSAFIFFTACHKKKDPALPDKQEFIEADLKNIQFDVYPGRRIINEVYLSFYNPKTGVQYDVDLSFAVNSSNATAKLSGFDLFLPTTYLADTSELHNGWFSVKGINNALDVIIEVTDNAKMEHTAYLQTKKLLLHFTPQTEVVFSEFNVKDVVPYTKPDGLQAAKVFYEDLLKKDMTNASVFIYMDKRN